MSADEKRSNLADSSLRGFLQLGFFIGGCGFLMAFFQPRESAEFVLSVCSGFLGLFLVAGCIVVVKTLKRWGQ
jgi:hypothetical protein